MATTTSFNSLLAPAADDSMEMSSPANRNLDDDIDIDFDDYTGGVQVADDEHMLEDHDAARPGTGTDDMMEDDVLPGEQALAEEEVMQDDGVNVQDVISEEDEDLIDYGEDEIHDDLVDDTVLPGVTEEATNIVDSGNDQVDRVITPVPGVAIPDVPPPGALEETSKQPTEIKNISAATQPYLDPSTNVGDNAQLESANQLVGEPHLFELGESALLESLDQPPANELATQPPTSLNTSLTAHTDTPGTPTDTGLHPMNVRYGDVRIPLFKSKRQLDGLLKDDNLANLSLAELIQNCRQRMAIKLGENVSDDQELILGFDQLGLMLVEDSRAAFESSLNDILEVYLQLHRNDHVQEVPPLSLSISLQLKFASSFNVFKQAAAGGQGMSTFVFLQPVGDGEYYHEEIEGGDGTGTYVDEYNEHRFEEQQDDEATEDEDAEEAGQQETIEDHGYDHEEYHQDALEQPNPNDQDQAPPGLEDLLQGEHQLTDTINSTLDNATATGKEVADGRATQDLEAAVGTTNQAQSRESSTTVQGDNGVNTNTANTSGAQYEDFSTFLTEFDATEEREAALKNAAHKENAADSTTQHVSELLEGEYHDPEDSFEAQHLGSEDFLNDLGEDGYGVEGHYDPQAEQDEGYELGEHYAQNEEEQSYDQADTYGEQQEEGEEQYDDEGYHPDYLPAEDEDQFHTANQDFFQGEYYEHGPEHDVYNKYKEDEDSLDDTVHTVVRHPVEDYEEGDTNEHFEDDIGFDDEAYDEHDERDEKAIRPIVSQESLGNKRSFDEHIDEDDLDFEEREVKKSRAS